MLIFKYESISYAVEETLSLIWIEVKIPVVDAVFNPTKRFVCEKGTKILLKPFILS